MSIQIGQRRQSTCSAASESHLHVDGHIYRRAVFRAGAKAPLLERVDCVLIQTETEAANKVHEVDVPVLPNDRLK